MRLLQLNHSKNLFILGSYRCSSQINSADCVTRYSEYLLILTHQLWNRHSQETDGEAMIPQSNTRE